RVLYMFRTPSGSVVGAKALDPTTRAALARLYPDVPFDWREITAHQQVVDVAEPFRPRRKKRPAEEPADATLAAGPDDAAEGTPAPRPSPLPAAIVGTTPEAQVAWLAEWCPKVREMIPERFHDEVRRQALDALAARLDPSGWTDDAAREVGLRDAAEAWTRLTKVFTHRRRRRRKPGGGRPPADAASV
ncbi:MAG: hypothetical protein AB7I25_14490, partial [Vicinamibacterales bacterium]